MRFCFIFLFIIFQSCQKETSPKEVTRGIYYWKSVFKLSPNEKTTLDSCHIQKLYVKAFDLDWDYSKKQFITKANIHFEENLPKNLVLIPTIFITNQVLSQISEEKLNDLADFIQTHLALVWKKNAFDEIQFDCDWTISTRQKYFYLLRQLKKNFPQKTFSATIRLHQIKFAHKTGIPPVERGMLMFYNMSNWKKPQIKNSIYDLEAASQYLGTLDKYPMPLDIVFPIFRWAIIYRNKTFFTVINNLDNQLLSKQKFLEKNHNTYNVLQDTFAFGISLRKGDFIRAEEVGFDEIIKGSATLREKISTQKLTFALYHLDQSNISFYGNEKLSQIYTSFE
jgi:hypothetical protein